MRGQFRKRCAPNSHSALLIQAPSGGEVCWPALDLEAASVLLLRHLPRREVDPATATMWCSYVGEERARLVFDWMSKQPDQWPLWGRLSCLFGEQAVRAIVIEGAERDAEEAAIRAEMARLEAEERRRLHEQIGLFVLDPKNKRPGLALENGDENKPFFVMRFSEKWERERVLDWLRWQKPRFAEYRELVAAEGGVALERLIIAGMRETEADLKRRRLSSGGRRPLRFWRGE